MKRTMHVSTHCGRIAVGVQVGKQEGAHAAAGGAEERDAVSCARLVVRVQQRQRRAAAAQGMRSHENDMVMARAVPTNGTCVASSAMHVKYRCKDTNAWFSDCGVPDDQHYIVG